MHPVIEENSQIGNCLLKSTAWIHSDVNIHPLLILLCVKWSAHEVVYFMIVSSWFNSQGGGGGYFTKSLVARFNTWNKLDPIWSKVCENEVPKRSKINEKGSQLDWKSRRKLIQNNQNLLNNTFWWKIRPTLGHSISWTKCDRNKPIFCRKRGSSGWY